MAEIEIFKNESFGEVRVAGTSEEPLFCLVDLCRVLDLQNPTTVKNRLDADDVQLIDLHALNLTEGSVGNTKANFVTESGFYDVILQSSSPKVKPFRKWVTSEVLPSIRKTGSYSVNNNTKQPSQLSLKDKLTWVRDTKKLLNLDDHSTLNMLQKIAEPLGLPLPEFVDEKEALSISDLLKNKGIMNGKGKYMSGQEGNKKLLEAGLIEQVTRYSRRKGKDVQQWVITKKGNKYGKMHQHKDASFPSPVWYVKTADELMELLSLSNAGGLS